MKPLGPQNAKLMILLDYPEAIEVARGYLSPHPELARMLHDAGLIQGQCFIACLSSRCPPLSKGAADLSSWLSHTKSPTMKSMMRLHSSWVMPSLLSDIERTNEVIELVNPEVIIAMGPLASFAITGKHQIKKWRGSELKIGGRWVVPVYSARYIFRDWAVRAITVHDIKRATSLLERAEEEPPVFHVRPTFGQALKLLDALLAQIISIPTRISIDIETRAGHIACIGFGTSRKEAFCIPLMCAERAEGYWSAVEECVLVQRMCEVMTHANAQCFGQNFIYDTQYIYRHWGIVPTTWYDTMNAEHVLFPGQPKGLDYLASKYCRGYVYWKDDGKNWDESIPEEQYWRYNCEDVVRTFEVMEAQQPLIAQQGLHDVWDFQQNKLYPMLLKAMIRGVRCDITNKQALSESLLMETTKRDEWVTQVCGHPLNIGSPKQMQEFFYKDLGFKPIINRKTGSPTVDDKALSTLRQREPLLRGLTNKIQEMRSLRVFRSTFVEARLDRDQKLRSSYNIAGTETYRLSSSENAFGSGLNFQNIPQKQKEREDPDFIELPNIRKLFLPDEGYTIFDMDLQSADFYTVVWEADDDEFKQALDSGIDMHGLNAQSLFNLSCGAGEVKKHHYAKRQLAKIWCHATNYGAGAVNMAKVCGITIKEAERLRARWFEMHPGILEWHRRTEHKLHTLRLVENRFGYRMRFFGRTDAALPEALGWVPQSTTGCVINRAWYNIEQTLPNVQMLIQVHDSLVGQVPTALWSQEYAAKIVAAARVVVPYEKPLIIPAGIAWSDKSWGECA